MSRTLPGTLAIGLLAFAFDWLPHHPHSERGRYVDTSYGNFELARYPARRVESLQAWCAADTSRWRIFSVIVSRPMPACRNCCSRCGRKGLGTQGLRP